MTAALRRLAMPNLVRLDLLLAVALGAELELEALSHGGGAAYRTGLTVAASALLAAPIAVRRRWPAGALLFSATVLTAQQLLGGYMRASNGVSAMLTLGVLAYAAGAWLELRAGLASLVVTATLFSGFNFGPGSGAPGGIGSDVFVVVVALIVPWLVGRIARARGRRAAAFRELAAKAAERRAESERIAVEGERLRISSELHDIIAHSVSAMVIQAAGARRLLRSDPRRARESILSVERSGRETLGDLRRLLGVLRSDDDPRALAPQPGLGQLGALAKRLAAAGLVCDLHTEGTPVDLTPGIDLVGYRVAEAALASAAGNGGVSATLIVRYQPRRLELEISGDGGAPDLEDELGGISERVALYDGSLQAFGESGRFKVLAQLPLTAAVAA